MQGDILMRFLVLNHRPKLHSKIENVVAVIPQSQCLSAIIANPCKNHPQQMLHDAAEPTPDFCLRR